MLPNQPVILGPPQTVPAAKAAIPLPAGTSGLGRNVAVQRMPVELAVPSSSSTNSPQELARMTQEV